MNFSEAQIDATISPLLSESATSPTDFGAGILNFDEDDIAMTTLLEGAVTECERLRNDKYRSDRALTQAFGMIFAGQIPQMMTVRSRGEVLQDIFGVALGLYQNGSNAKSWTMSGLELLQTVASRVSELGYRLEIGPSLDLDPSSAKSHTITLLHSKAVAAAAVGRLTHLLKPWSSNLREIKRARHVLKRREAEAGNAGHGQAHSRRPWRPQPASTAESRAAPTGAQYGANLQNTESTSAAASMSGIHMNIGMPYPAHVWADAQASEDPRAACLNHFDTWLCDPQAQSEARIPWASYDEMMTGQTSKSFASAHHRPNDWPLTDGFLPCDGEFCSVLHDCDGAYSKAQIANKR